MNGSENEKQQCSFRLIVIVDPRSFPLFKGNITCRLRWVHKMFEEMLMLWQLKKHQTLPRSVSVGVIARIISWNKMTCFKTTLLTRRVTVKQIQAGLLTYASSFDPPSRQLSQWLVRIALRNYSSGPVQDFHPTSLFCACARLHFSYVAIQTLAHEGVFCQ